MNSSIIVPAHYQRTDVRRFDGNAFIEALPRLPSERNTFLTQLAHYPDAPTAALRDKSEVVRLMEVNTLTEIVYPFPDYEKPAITLATMLRETYIARNPISVTDIQRRHALAASEKDGLPFPSDWQSSARGLCLLSVTGMGKTTFINAFLLRYPQVIKHEAYDGHPLKCHQVVYVMLRVPHDATLKSLCLQFFSEIDRLLGTEYYRKALTLRNISPMVELMNQVATSVSLGLIIIDEVQNIRSATGNNAEFMLNLFGEIIERIGISLLLMATPALNITLSTNVRNTRKGVSIGYRSLSPMKRDSEEWIDFTDTYWDHTYVRNKARLTKKIRDAWYNVSAGDTAFAVLAYLLTQRNAIGGVEIVNEAGFHQTFETDMAILAPAIRALLSRKTTDLVKFDDLLFGNEYESLMSQLKVDFPTSSNPNEEFDDIVNATNTAKSRSKARRPPYKKNKADLVLPTENPLQRTTNKRT